jgi:hypothetical protein
MAYVLGFVVIFVPNGLGVREYFLTIVLAPQLATRLHGDSEAQGIAILAVLLLRVVWTAAELVLAAGLYWVGARSGGTGLAHQESDSKNQEQSAGSAVPEA